MRTAKSGSPVRKLIENKKPADSADILTDTNNNGINMNIINNNENSYKDYNDQSEDKERDADSTSASAVRPARNVLTTNTAANQSKTRNAGKIHRIDNSAMLECEDCRLRDGIQLMKITYAKTLNQI
ncbi:MAG TPA: hypothetical protein VFD60_06110 [Nitrososphaeraceae archaeon]|nr:hypothetical protein [Nitrososphaeraceae archaeon]